MSIDTTPLGELAALVMDAITEHLGDEFTVRTAAIIVEVDSPKQGRLLARCTDDRPWVLSALLAEAQDSIDAARADIRQHPNSDE